MCCLGYMCTKGRCLQHGWFQPQTQDIDVLATCFELARRCLPDTADASLYTGLVQVSTRLPLSPASHPCASPQAAAQPLTHVLHDWAFAGLYSPPLQALGLHADPTAIAQRNHVYWQQGYRLDHRDNGSVFAQARQTWRLEGTQGSLLPTGAAAGLWCGT